MRQQGQGLHNSPQHACIDNHSRLARERRSRAGPTAAGAPLLRSHPMARGLRPRRIAAWLGLGLLVAGGCRVRKLPLQRRRRGPGHLDHGRGGPAGAGPTGAHRLVGMPGRLHPPVRHRLGAGRLPAPRCGLHHPGRDPGPGARLRPSGGTLVFNPGGPGESGNQILPVELQPAARRPSASAFDVVSFDPRGTGASDPLRCGTSPSALPASSRVPASAGRPLPSTPFFTAMARACQVQRPHRALHQHRRTPPGTWTGSARRSVVPKISFYGTSYGTVLGAVYADLFPHRVATMVLDGAVDVNATLTQQAEQEAPAAEQSLHHLFATCRPAGAMPARP